MYSLKRTLYLFLVFISFFAVVEGYKSTSGNINNDTKQIVEAEKYVPGKVPELIFKSQKIKKLKLEKKLSLTIAFQTRQQEELNNLITSLYNPSSPNYHKWLAPEEFGEKFGRSEKEFNDAINWLMSQGFTIEQVWSNRLAISFSGSVELVEQVFQVEISEYQDQNKRIFYSNNQSPKLPKAIKSITSSIYGLNNAYLHKPSSRLRPFSIEEQKRLQDVIKGGGKLKKDFKVGGSPIFFGPDDFALAYNIAPVTDSGIQGQGQRIAIIIDSDVLDTDIDLHRQLFGLPFSNVKRAVPPGLEKAPVKFQGEAELDINSISLIAPMAEITLVLIPDLDTANIFLAEQFIINTLKIPIVNESFGGCESEFYDPAEQMLMLQGVAQGTAFFVSAGDEGAECFPGGTSGQAAINCPACYDGVTAVGGTEIIGDYDLFGDLTKVLQESVWNEPPGVRFDCDGQFLPSGGGATGGGISQKVARPNYQNMATGFDGGVPSGTKRVIPDVSLLAGTPGTAIIVNQNGFIIGGTSQSAPLWAGIMALINQSKNVNQGSPNTELYRLGKAQFKDKTTKTFFDVTFGNNNTMPRSPCTNTGAKGFLASPGYDLSTGWGVPDVESLIKNFAPDTIPPTVKVTAPQSGDTFNVGDKIRIDWQTTDNSRIIKHSINLSTDGGVSFPIIVADGLPGNAQNFIFTIPNMPTSQARIRVTAVDEPGNTGVGISQGNFSITTPIQAGFILSLNPSLQSIIAGNSANFALTAQPMGGFAGQVNLSVKVEPTDSSLKITLPGNLLIPSNGETLQISSSSTTQGDFKITVIGTGKGSNGEQISNTTVTMLKVIQPDFSLVVDSPQLKFTRGQKLTIPIRIDRTANFAGKVTVNAPDTSLLKLKLSPSSQVTTGTNISFSLKSKKSGPIGNQELVFTGQDDLGRIRTVKVNLLIE